MGRGSLAAHTGCVKNSKCQRPVDLESLANAFLVLIMRWPRLRKRNVDILKMLKLGVSRGRAHVGWVVFKATLCTEQERT